MIVLIDNYDSFTFNLYQYIAEIVSEQTPIEVFRNDRISVADVLSLDPSYIVLSPGPCTPNEAGISIELVKTCLGKIPVLGICLGHQSIGQAFGANIIRASLPVHGKCTKVFHSESGIFFNIEQGFQAGRYHSLIIEKESLPEDIEVSAWSTDGEIMAITHKYFRDIIGLQFHPESVLTPCGKLLLRHFLAPH